MFHLKKICDMSFYAPQNLHRLDILFVASVKVLITEAQAIDILMKCIHLYIMDHSNDVTQNLAIYSTGARISLRELLAEIIVIKARGEHKMHCVSYNTTNITLKNTCSFTYT